MTVELEQYEDRVIVFIDILGFREHIKKTVDDPDFFIKLRNVLNFMDKLKNEKVGEKKEITAFSDSIVISYSLELPGSVFWLLLDVIHIQLEMMANGILMRGGIAVGKLCHSDNIVYGPAMVEAYELESKVAIYPRVVISENVLGAAALNPANNLEEELASIAELCEEDWDGQWFVDFLSQQQEVDSQDNYIKALQEIKKVIIDEISKNESKSDVRMKYQWLRNYYNEVASKLREELGLQIT